MIGKTWIAIMVGAFVMFGGLATVAAGSMNGDCLQDQDRLQLKDGSCQDDLEDAAATDGMNGDCLQDQDRLQLKDGSCQDETFDALAMEGDCLQDKIQDQLKLQDGSCIETLVAEDANYNYAYYYWSFVYSELQDGETPYMWQSQNQCSAI